MRRVVFIQGGGIGLDQEPAVRRLVRAAGVEIDWEVFPAGWHAQSQGLAAVPQELIAAVRETQVALKTKLLPAPKKKPMDDKRGGRPGMAGGDRGGMGGGGARPPRF